jgi:membrane protease subunit HflC
MKAAERRPCFRWNLFPERRTAVSRRNKTVIGIIAGIALLILISGLFVVTPANEYTVITQFGKVIRVNSEPGLTFKAPFLQAKVSIPKYRMVSDLVPSDVTTKDKKVMNVDSFVIWDIQDPVKYMISLGGDSTKAESRLGNVVYNSIKTVMSATNQEDIISGTERRACTVDHKEHRHPDGSVRDPRLCR